MTIQPDQLARLPAPETGRVTPDEAVERVHLALELLPYPLSIIT